MLTFSPRTVTKEMIATLPERSRDILMYRYGLGKGGERRTLESIGSDYGITRERVRQIEAHGLSALQNSEIYEAHANAVANLEEAIRGLGGVLSEEDVLNELPKNKADQNAVVFLLTVGQPFADERETNDFARRWSVDSQLAGRIYQALSDLHDALDPNDLIPEDEFIRMFGEALVKVGVKEKDQNVLKRWVNMAKRIGRNPLGEWGRATSPSVRAKSMRDLAYLALKRHGSPMHFTEVAQSIKELFGRPAHPATCHNELIKDSRFILVGRGLYALEEWGYAPGVVRDVITKVLESGPLTRDEIIDRVKRERYVKDATILVNLQSGPFRRTSDGKYELA